MTRAEPQDPEPSISEQSAANISEQGAATAETRAAEYGGAEHRGGEYGSPEYGSPDEYGSAEHGSPDHNEFDCSRARLQLYEYLDGEMAPDDCAKIREHLAQCGPCLREYDLDQMLKALVRRSCSAETAPTQLRMQIMSSITTINMTIEIRD
jgi:anti-sigma factor (TIGR02949 family)